jgi:hypothetical protein
MTATAIPSAYLYGRNRAETVYSCANDAVSVIVRQIPRGHSRAGNWRVTVRDIPTGEKVGDREYQTREHAIAYAERCAS